MNTNRIYVAAQQCIRIRQEHGEALSRGLDKLRSLLNYEASRRRGEDFSRAYAELREARSLIASLKYAEANDPLGLDELSWALRAAKLSLRDDTGLFDGVAEALSINIDQPQPIPADLARKIANELALISRATARTPLAEAV